MQPVFVLSVAGTVLFPTTRFGHVRRLLKAGRARVVCSKPFQIQLLYKEKYLYETPENKKIILGMDPGRVNIGLASINKIGKVLFAIHAKTRNKEIPILMKERKTHRSASRRGERLVRIRRAKKAKTLTSFPNGRMLPGYSKPVMIKNIINSEARFNNRKRPKDWITPTTRHLINTHISLIKKVNKFIPIHMISFEVNKFAFMKLDNNECYGVDFQNGRLRGYEDVYEFVYERQDGFCCICQKKKIEHYHHLIPRCQNGSDTADNLIGVCKSCHEKIHLGKAAKKLSGIKKKYHHLSVLNQSIPFIIKELKQFNVPIQLVTGRETYDYRLEHNIPKDHFFDAACIASINNVVNELNLNFKVYHVKQFRRHNRQIVFKQTERRYYIGKEKVATNRKPRFDQKGDSLRDWFDKQVKLVGLKEAEKLRSQLRVVKSTRSLNNLKRVLPGAIFKYENKKYALQAQKSSKNTRYYIPVSDDEVKFNQKKCKILAKNVTLVFI